MNTKIKIAIGVMAGVIAGTTILGSAFAVPRMMGGPGFDGYSMMRSSTTTDSLGSPIAADMQSFMNRYRDATGRIDMYRMHSDVVSGRTTPPRHVRPQSPSTNVAPRGYGMMGALRAPTQGSGLGMMSNSY